MKILILAANPKGTQPLRLDEEIREIDEGLRRAKKREQFSIQQKWALRPKDLRQAMLDVEPQIVHFCGHGESSGLMLEDAMGQSKLVEPEALAELFELFASQVECVILNACYSEAQAQAISKHIDCVIGMSKTIDDQTAIEFAVGFYDALGGGRTIEDAYKFGCNAIRIAGIPEHLTPVLIKKQREKQIKNSKIGNSRSYRDWANAPDVGIFFGRNEELATLKKWVIQDHCRVIAVLGLLGIGKTRLSVKLGRGGIGKTDLSVKLALGIQEEFEYVIWRSLLNAPPITSILRDLIKFLSNQQADIPDTIEGQILRLLYYLQEHRSLIIFDNFESVLQGGGRTGQYLAGYEEYGNLIQQIGQVSHQSCLLLTSREKPPEIARLENNVVPVRSLELDGLDVLSGRRMFEAVDFFFGSERDWNDLIALYNGNPLALELAAKHISQIFGGRIHDFLNQGKPVFSDLRELLDWHFNRLSLQEKEIVYWLAINREPIRLSLLQEDIIPVTSKEQAPSCLQELQRRLPLETNDAGFTLQPVLIEYMTEKLVDGVVQEIQSMRLQLFNSHALLKALSHNSIREIQERLIVRPIVERLLYVFGNREKLEFQLKSILSLLHRDYLMVFGYACGNLLNLLRCAGINLSGYDFSSLIVSQAYLQGVDLPDVDFSFSDLSKSVFTQSFGSILSVAFDPESKFIAIGELNGDVRLWHVADNQQLWTCKAHTSWIRSVVFSPDGEFLASAGDDRQINLWEVKTGRHLRTFEGHTGWVYCVAFNSTGDTLISSSEDQTVRLWSIKSGETKVLQGHTEGVRAVAFSFDNEVVVSGSQDKTLKVWRVDTGECIATLIGHNGAINSLAFGHSNLVATGSDDHTLRLWDLRVGKCLRVLSGHTANVQSVAFDEVSGILVSCSDDQSIRLWDIENSGSVQILEGHKKRVWSIALSKGGKALVSGSEDQTIRLWDISTGQTVTLLQGYSNGVESVAFSPSSEIVASGGEDGNVRLWDISAKECFRTLKGHTDWVRFLAFSLDGKVLASCGYDKTIRLWLVETGECIQSLTGHNDWVRCVAFHSSGRILASSSYDKTARLWDTVTGNCIAILSGHTDWVRVVDYGLNDNILATGSHDRTIKLWAVPSGKCLKTLRGHRSSIRSIVFNPKDDFLVSGSIDGVIKLWEIDSGRCLKTWQGHSKEIESLAFSPDGLILASASSDQSIKLWDVHTGKQINTLIGHTYRVASVDFSLNGRFLVSGSRDETIRLWDVHMGKCVSILTVKRPYEGMNITGVKGVTLAQISTLKTLGAIDNAEEASSQSCSISSKAG